VQTPEIEKNYHFKQDRDFGGQPRCSVYGTSTTAITNTDINNNIWAYINVYNSPSMFQPLTASTICLMSFSCKSNLLSKIFVELQLKLHRRAFVKFVIRLCRSETDIGRCWARMRGQGSSSVIRGLRERSINDNDDRLEDSSKTFGSMNAIRLLIRDSEISRCRLVNTPSCRQQNSLLLDHVNVNGNENCLNTGSDDTMITMQTIVSAFGQNIHTESMVTIRSPFCGYNLA